jgi:hypothetical protein
MGVTAPARAPRGRILRPPGRGSALRRGVTAAVRARNVLFVAIEGKRRSQRAASMAQAKESRSHADCSGLQAVEDAPVDRTAKLFRFLDFTKYVAMLDQRAMHFTPVDRLADPYEGAQPKPAAARGTDCVHEPLKRSVLVNCWHANPHESAAMWRLYLKSDEGVALQTSVERLTWAFSLVDQPLFIGAVRYLDYERDDPPGSTELSPFFWKRKAYEYEREVRLVTRLGEDQPAQGRYVPCDLSRLIERVVVSPGAQPWFEDLVRSVTRHYGFDFQIAGSELARDPGGEEQSRVAQ